jgi:type I restriction enzyme R subunit
LFVELATAAERAFSSDPNTTLIKLRQLGEALAQHLAALSGIEFDQQTSQSDLLYRLQRELRLEPQIKELFHTLRVEGNKATHQLRTRHKEAMDGFRTAPYPTAGRAVRHLVSRYAPPQQHPLRAGLF